jgi:magnesium chelatase family protein
MKRCVKGVSESRHFEWFKHDYEKYNLTENMIMALARYQKKISGPFLDHIDIHVEVSRVDYEKLADKRNVEDSKTIRARVQAARERQLERFAGTKWTCNAEMGPTEVHHNCQTDASGERLLKAAVQ